VKSLPSKQFLLPANLRFFLGLMTSLNHSRFLWVQALSTNYSHFSLGAGPKALPAPRFFLVAEGDQKKSKHPL
jgi:hypothetical protein